MLSAESAAGKYPVEAVQAIARIAEGTELDTVNLASCWDSLQHLCSDAGKSFALSSMASASKVHNDLGVAIVTQKGETPLLMSRCQSNATIWALSNNYELLSKMTILRGVTPTYFDYITHSPETLAQQILRLLENKAQSANISSILITQLEELEGVGDINVCRLLRVADSQIPSQDEIAA